MKQKLGIILVACLSLALCLALAACGGINKSLYVGTWELQDSNGETFDSDTMDLMQTLGVKVTLSLDEDNTGVLNYLGNDPHSATWKATSNTEGEVSIDGKTYTLSLEDAVLTMTDDEGTYMKFAKVSDEPLTASAIAAPESESAASASAASESASAESASSQAAATTDEGDEATETDEVAGDDEGYDDGSEIDYGTSEDEGGEWTDDGADYYDDSEPDGESE